MAQGGVQRLEASCPHVWPGPGEKTPVSLIPRSIKTITKQLSSRLPQNGWGLCTGQRLLEHQCVESSQTLERPQLRVMVDVAYLVSWGRHGLCCSHAGIVSDPVRYRSERHGHAVLTTATCAVCGSRFPAVLRQPSVSDGPPLDTLQVCAFCHLARGPCARSARGSP